MSGSRPAPYPGVALVVWLAATLIWWSLAFAPLSRDPPAWLAAARYACFGPMETGLPAAEGWIMLVLAPASFLVALVVVWGRETTRTLVQAVRSRAGRCVLGVAALAVAVEIVWVGGALRTAWVVTAGDAAAEVAGPLPADYPRGTAVAPDFTLVDQHGRPVSLADLRGHPVALTFVFAHCQALCPLVVSSVARAVADEPTGRALLVTLDPWRDTPSVLPAVAERWRLPPNAHLLSSRSTDTVLRAVRAYGVPFERNETSGDIVHPGLVYLIDAEGRMAYAFNNPAPAWIREGFRRLGGAHGPTG